MLPGTTTTMAEDLEGLDEFSEEELDSLIHSPLSRGGRGR
jgi:hypothetical protein